jgi:hypothetical protein
VFEGIEEARDAGANLLGPSHHLTKSVIEVVHGYGLLKSEGEHVTTPLDSIPGWTPEKVSRMKDVGITTAEQVVAVAATKQGLQSLSEQLQVNIEEARQLYLAARDGLPPEARQELDQPADTTDLGRGALPPPVEGD